MATSFSISNPSPIGIKATQKFALALVSTGLVLMLLAFAGFRFDPSLLYISLLSIIIGTAWYAFHRYRNIGSADRNDGTWFKSLVNRGALGWSLGILLTAFYVVLYWFPSTLGLAEARNVGLIGFFDPLSLALKGKVASQWFVYGTLYSVAVLAMGIKFLFKYRGNRYQSLRTISVVFFQLVFAYFIPEILEGLLQEQPYFVRDLKHFWPLNHYFFEPWHLDNMRASGSLGMFYLVWGIVGFAVLTPFLTYFVGKRWYCSWVCGCGGLAETAGDPFRHLSSKKLSAWRIERWLIHGILVYIIIVTSVVMYGYFSGNGEILGLSIYHYFSKPYGFMIGSIFAGVAGVGFYPVLGNRVWCRFGCPMAAYMGIFQRFKSRFRITTNGGQCISCGNCSVYCEQGIDVRWYAQRGQNIVRASCVGCGICSSVCPRGVLKLENAPEQGRINDGPISIGKDSINLQH